ncbi:hypothetical protein BKA82DRAFT_33212 [Pisolithus tinctorius]|uniref:Uncharacterized protein n=1 Tax=Pisolithus tinctorius Marx 270 TaxID=870435 RepID=A0A0C3IHK4_PISTI|nr:hypothetical protein BKA82DRAFT_33212 [Pisolithus tinctorius]KIN96502.1 hypothetical protein M404DRAFT_33212 [Pisolithus tinctorius Marx 270]
MSANHAPCLSQLIHAATPDPVEAEKAALKTKFEFAAASTALVAEAKCMPDNRDDLWEEKKMGEVVPIVKCSRELDIDTKIDMADGLAIAEADGAYKQWVAKEIMQNKIDKDMRMGEAALQDIREQQEVAERSMATAKMSHIEAGPLKKAVAKDEEDIEIVKTCRHSKGKVPAHGGVDKSTAMALSQALTLVRAKANTAHMANLHL